MFNKNLLFMGILLMALVVVAGCEVAQHAPVPSPAGDVETQEAFNPGGNIETSSFKNVAELKAFLRAYDGGSYGNARGGVLMMMEDAVAEVAESAPVMAKTSGAEAPMPSRDYSETNVQVAGVDEGDIIKTDGNYIYTVTEKTLFIIKAYPGEDAKVVHKMSFDGRPTGLFINGNKLVVFGNVEKMKPLEKLDFTPRSGMSFLEIYDVADKKSPKKLKDYKFEGRYFQSRMIDDYVYLIVTSRPEYRRPVPLPMIVEGGVSRPVPIEDVNFFPIPYDSTQYSTIHAINLNDESVNSKTLLVESSQNMYMSKNNIYITYTKYINEWQIRQDVTMVLVEPKLSLADKQYVEKVRKTDNDILSPNEKKNKVMQVVNSYVDYLPTEEKDDLEDLVEKLVKERMEKYEANEYTVIHRVEVDGSSIKVRANGRVPGHVINQFSMDEYQGVLRMGTTINARWGMWAKLVNRRESTNHVFTLDSQLNVMDRIDDIAEGERIFSTRFMGDRLYMVTFKQVDPFFVFDLSNPNDIKELGKLKIPGFSKYLHPYDDEIIIGLGRDTTDGGRTRGLKISLFDVSDVNNPREVAKYVSKERYAQSAAEFEHKAFLFSKEKNLLVIPVYSQDYRDEEKGYNGALVFDIQADKIELRGLVDHSRGLTSRWYRPSVERSLYIEDLLYTKSPNLLRINKIEDLGSVKDIDLKTKYEGGIPIF